MSWVDKEAGDTVGSPPPRLITLGVLLDRLPPHKVEPARAALAKTTRAKLATLYTQAYRREQRVQAWLINQEYSRRGVPPSLRPGLEVDESRRELLLDGLAVDLEWIAVTYRKHVTYFSRWRKFVEPNSFHSQVRYIFGYGGRESKARAFLVKGLALDDKKQVECHYARTEKFDNRYRELLRRQSELNEKLRDLHNIRLRRSGGEIVPRFAGNYPIVERKVNVWLCANLADWSPTRTAWFYNAMTGAGDPTGDQKSMTRQQAANVMNDLKRDLEKKEARPW